MKAVMKVAPGVGNIEVRDAGDRVEMHAVSGDIRASKLRGRIRANTVAGYAPGLDRR